MKYTHWVAKAEGSARRSELLRKLLKPDDVVQFSWGSRLQTGRVLAVERNSLLLEFRYRRFLLAQQLTYDRITRLVGSSCSEEIDGC